MEAATSDGKSLVFIMAELREETGAPVSHVDSFSTMSP